MNFENEPRYYSPSSPSSSSSKNQLSPCRPPDPENSRSASSSHARFHKRKAGRKKFRETRHPVYRGVRQRNGDRWVCEVREPNKKSRIWLGTYPTPEMAARAHDAAVLALRGTSAMFNFPDSASLLPVARSSSAADIREAASKAADAFAPTNINPSNSLSVPMSSDSSANNLCVETNPCIVNNTCAKEGVGNDDDGSKSIFFDEEAWFNMPGLLDSMAEGLLITPPSMERAFDWDDVELGTDLALWTD